MIFSPPFREGARAAVPIWIAFLTVSFTLGIAAKSYGLNLGEIMLMSALVFAGPAQFAALGPLATAKAALQILLTTFLINLRFLVMSAALTRYFYRVRLATLLASSHFISISTFVVPYLHFQKKSRSPAPEELSEIGRENLHYFLGLALTSFCVWVLGSGFGYWAALRFPSGLEEGLKFMLPGFFACMLTAELREKPALLVGVASFFAAVPAALANPEWGWFTSALLIATLGWGIDRWIQTGLR